MSGRVIQELHILETLRLLYPLDIDIPPRSRNKEGIYGKIKVNLSLLTSALIGGDWSASRPRPLYHRGRVHGAHRIGG
jgi:hypothetical protein